jgi:1-acyl-sn-glycerol-3-phosphate acyltransferase
LLDVLGARDKRRLLNLGRIWSRIVFRSNPFWRMRITGLANLDPAQPYVVVANHQSFGDILVSIHLPLRMRFVAKRVLFLVPFWGWQIWLLGHLPIRRGDRASGGRLLVRAEETLRLGQSVLFFPEGTRSTTGEVGPFKSGAFRLAARAGVPVLPVAIAGTGNALPKHSILFRDRAFARVHVLPPVRIDRSADVARVRDAVREQMAAAKRLLDAEVADGLREWSALPKKPALLA